MADRVLLVYQTSEGHTAEVAERIAAILRAGTDEVTLTPVHDAPDNLAGYDGVVVGGSIHFAKYDSHLTKYAKQHAAELNRLPSAFFTVCMRAAEGQGDEDPEVQSYLYGFTKETHWRPDITAVFGGELAYTKYGMIKRLVMRHIASNSGLSTDTKHDHDYTDWDAVEHFACDVLKHVGTVSHSRARV